MPDQIAKNGNFGGESRLMSRPKPRNFWQTFGPGILFAGAAIGTSHLVQSTRAGAVYGLGLLIVVIATHLLKYPTYRFGPQYAAATGRSLIEGYRELGAPIVALFALSEFTVGCIIVGATALTTSAMLLGILDINLDARCAAIGILIFGILILRIGGYKLLDRLTKVFIATLTVCTVLSTILAIPKVKWSVDAFSLPEIDAPTFAFLIALMGFMPAAMSLSVLNSLWTAAKAKSEGIDIEPPQAVADFNIGYAGSAILAMCFLVMGAGVMHTAGIEPASGAASFAKQVIGLYTSNLGNWSGVVVGISAISVMFTTLLTILDGFPRLQVASWLAISSQTDLAEVELDRTPLYSIIMVMFSAGGIAILLLFMGNFKQFIDFVTISAFIVAPLCAILNHLAINSKSVPAKFQPNLMMNTWSIASITALSLLGFTYMLQVFSHQF